MKFSGSHLRRGAGLAGALLVMLLVAMPLSAAEISGTSIVEGYGEVGFEGYWRYCLDLAWDTSEMGGQGMSFVNFLIGLGECPCACSPDIILFGDVAGAGIGVDGCELLYGGLFDCRGDPHFPEIGPSVKFEYLDNGCEAGSTGSATVCFYSTFAPGQPLYHSDVLGIKASTNTATGDLIGVLPICMCGSPVEDASWGVVKALYR
jgi:hypothetical protein